jgi:hypothetical protein
MRTTVPIKSNDVDANQEGTYPRQTTHTNNSASSTSNAKNGE